MDKRRLVAAVGCIDSVRHPTIQHLAKVARDKDYRIKHGSILIGGHKIVQDYCVNGSGRHDGVKAIWITRKYLEKHYDSIAPKWKNALVDEHCIEYITREAAPEGIIAEVDMPTMDKVTKPVVKREGLSELVMTNAQIPGNVGNLIRSVVAFGIDRVQLVEPCCDPFNYEVIRSSAGAALWAKVDKQKSIASLIERWKTHGILPIYSVCNAHGNRIGGSLIKEHPLIDLILPKSMPKVNGLALVLGSEGTGIPEVLLKSYPGVMASIKVSPSARIQSLNLAVAGAFLLGQPQIWSALLTRLNMKNK